MSAADLQDCAAAARAELKGSGGFRRVHPYIRVGQKATQRLMQRGITYSQTHRQGVAVIRAGVQLPHRGLYTLFDESLRGTVGIDEQNSEFIATEPGNDVRVSEGAT